MARKLSVDRLSLEAGSPPRVGLGPYFDRYKYWFTLYEYLFGELPYVVPVGGVDRADGPPLRGLVCDHPFYRDNVALGSLQTWEHSDKLLAHCSALGYQAWNCRCFNQFPLIETYAELHTRYVCPEFGFDMDFSGQARRRLKIYDWLQLVFENVFPIHLTTEEFFHELDRDEMEEPQLEVEVEMDNGIVPHVIQVVHDVSQHVLNYHYFPKELLNRLVDRFKDGLAGDGFGDALKEKPGPLAGFYDNDLNVYSYALWAQVDDPADFPNIATEPYHLRQLFSYADQRVRETRIPGPTPDVERANFDIGRLQVQVAA